MVMFFFFFWDRPELPASDPSDSASADPDRALRPSLSVVERRIILNAGEEDVSDGTTSTIRTDGLEKNQVSMV